LTLTLLQKMGAHMHIIRRANDRGQANHGWLHAQHSFSFANYANAQWMGWGQLRVLNEDRVAPLSGFGKHPHKDMEIVTYMIAGEISHEDSMGNGATIKAGQMQRMTAGTGVFHSEHNHHATQTAHLLQIWLQPSAKNLTPSYEDRTVNTGESLLGLQLLASATGVNGSMKLNAHANIYIGHLTASQTIEHPLDPNRRVWVQIIKGQAHINGQQLTSGDALGLAQESRLHIAAHDATQVLVLDVAPE
jgi:quercetin 2,3-dioxygenase